MPAVGSKVANASKTVYPRMLVGMSNIWRKRKTEIGVRWVTSVDIKVNPFSKDSSGAREFYRQLKGPYLASTNSKVEVNMSLLTGEEMGAIKIHFADKSRIKLRNETNIYDIYDKILWHSAMLAGKGVPAVEPEYEGEDTAFETKPYVDGKYDMSYKRPEINHVWDQIQADKKK